MHRLCTHAFDCNPEQDGGMAIDRADGICSGTFEKTGVMQHYSLD